MTKSVFEQYEERNYPFRWSGTIHMESIAGGIPSDPKKAEGWLRSRILADAVEDQRLQDMVTETMVERGVTADTVIEELVDKTALVGFKRDGVGLYVEGRQLKAALKEAASVAANAGRITTKGWGSPDNANYKKGLKAWFPEHVFVVERRLPLGVSEPSEIDQQFVHGRYGSSIQYQEVVRDVEVDFTVETDFDFSEKQWAAIWQTAERLGLGASRPRDFGRFVVTRWDRV
jgi:hypothetical protein